MFTKTEGTMKLFEEKCTSMGVKFQIRDKQLLKLPGTRPPSIRFSGSRDDELQHIFECVQQGSKVIMMLFSPILKYSDDMTALGNEIKSLNAKTEHGLWLFDQLSSLKQFCFVVTVHIDPGVKETEEVKKLLWQTVMYADSSFKKLARDLLAFVGATRKIPPSGIEGSPSWFPDPLINGVKKRLTSLLCGDVEQCVTKSVVKLKFQTKFEDDKVSERFRSVKAEVKVEEKMCQVEVFFCENGTVAAFLKSHQVDQLWKLLNRLNEALRIGLFVFSTEDNSVRFRYRFQYRDLPPVQVPVLLHTLIASILAKFSTYFAALQRFYQTPIKLPHSSEKREIAHALDETHTTESNFTPEEFKEECLELEKVRNSDAGRFFEFTCISIDKMTGVIAYKTPGSYIPFSAFLTIGELIPSKECINYLHLIIRSLIDTGLWYTDLSSVLYFVGEGAINPLVILPQRLAKKKCKENGYLNLMLEVTSQMLAYERLFSEYHTAEGLASRIPVYNMIKADAILPSNRGNKNVYRLGLKDVELIPVLTLGTFRDVHNLIQQLQLTQKFSHLQNQAKAFGFTYKNNTLYLVTESFRDFPTLRTYLIQKVLSLEEGLKLVDSIVSTVHYFHSAGISHLFLSPDLIRVREIQGVAMPLFPAVPILNNRTCDNVLKFASPEVLQELGKDQDLWSSDKDWKQADLYTCILLSVCILCKPEDWLSSGEDEEGQDTQGVRGSKRSFELCKNALKTCVPVKKVDEYLMEILVSLKTCPSLKTHFEGSY